jgi:hypothetical protein
VQSPTSDCFYSSPFPFNVLSFDRLTIESLLSAVEHLIVRLINHDLVFNQKESIHSSCRMRPMFKHPIPINMFHYSSLGLTLFRNRVLCFLHLDRRRILSGASPGPVDNPTFVWSRLWLWWYPFDRSCRCRCYLRSTGSSFVSASCASSASLPSGALCMSASVSFVCWNAEADEEA